SICEWGGSKPWLWAKGVGQLWRTTGDIGPGYDTTTQWTKGWKLRLDENVGLEKYAGPGHWNDPDMLEVGVGDMSYAESRAHFSLWCMLAAPLLAGNDVRHMKPEIRDILINRDLIAIDQDPLGKEGYRVAADAKHEIWIKELSHGDWAVCVLNTSPTTETLHVKWSELPFVAGHQYSVRDLWGKKDVGTTGTEYTGQITSHDVVVFRLHPE
ncbi:MAG TPA: glycoside hydrolase family 27 protein, partial [Tepidisphaeraceae bacterium]|nr:glycoside hydrolase family 27 protein [Tepidisphaeraceae bacterium]